MNQDVTKEQHLQTMSGEVAKSGPGHGLDGEEGAGFDEGLGVYPYPYGYAGASEPAAPEGAEAFAGETIEGEELATLEAVEAALREVYDPEIPVNIYDLGLIYEVRMEENGDVFALMSLTAPACPVAGELPQQVADQIASVDGVGRVCVRLTWNPQWNPSMMSEDARMALDFF
ncbi:MAG: iron-sulfur cluster assembly protein [Pseudomonadota bacterium]